MAEEAPITEFGNLLSGRAAGVQVLKSSGATGTGTKIRIRGSNSVSLSNEPLYYVDGVRIDATADWLSRTTSAGSRTSRINDLNPDDIENIEIVKGPSAATLYGIQAANGVVLITTKRGVAARPAGTCSWSREPSTTTTPTVRTISGAPTTRIWDTSCTLVTQVQGDCVQSRVDAYNPLNDPVQRPLVGRAIASSTALNVAGGSDAATYYVSAEYEGEVGRLQAPGLRPRLGQRRQPAATSRRSRSGPTSWTSSTFGPTRPPRSRRTPICSSRSAISPASLHLLENDNTLNSVIGSGDGSGVPPGYQPRLVPDPGGDLCGAEPAGHRPVHRRANRELAAARWLSTRATFGYDVTNRQDTQFWPTGEINPVAYPTQNGARSTLRGRRPRSSRWICSPRPATRSPRPGAGEPRVGGQFFRNLNTNSFAQGRGLARGSESIFGAATTDASDDYVESRSAGGFVDQQMSFRNRLFLTAGLRLDDNSAFGKNFNTKPLPKLSASWLARDQQARGWLNTLRLRAAYGQSTQQPGSIDALRFYAQSAVRKDAASSQRREP